MRLNWNYWWRASEQLKIPRATVKACSWKSLLIHPYPCKMPRSNDSLRSARSRPRTSWSVEIPHISVRPPPIMSHSVALDQDSISWNRRAEKWEEGWKNVPGHHHTSHCPFEWNCYPPDSPPGTHQLNLDANNPPSSHSSPALSLSPLSFITLSHPHCTLPHLSPWEPLWDWVLFLWPLRLFKLDELFFFFPPPRASSQLMHVFKACRVCANATHDSSREWLQDRTIKTRSNVSAWEDRAK